ncbi:MAG: FkbM family methyltransferase [Halioglobus sp.]
MPKLTQIFSRLKNRWSTMHPLNIANFNVPLKMLVHSGMDAHISTAIAQRGIWEPAETRFIINTLKPGDSLVDVGANIGYFTLIASALVGTQGKVFAFEPDPKNFAILATNIEANHCANVQLFEAALSNQTSQGKLFLSDTNMGDHTIYSLDDGRSSTDISLVNGAELFHDRREKIDFLKVDTQGSEFQVIEGLVTSLEYSLPGLVMLLEFSPNSIIKTGATGTALLDLLEPLAGFFYILDSKVGDLIPISMEQIRKWCKLTELDTGSEGFINLIFSGTPLDDRPALNIVEDLGLFDNALEYLVGCELKPWNGHHCNASGMAGFLYFCSGWSFFEEWGVWSNGSSSRIKFYIDPELRNLNVPLLELKCRYFGDKEETLLSINNIDLGSHTLDNAKIALPPECLKGDHITLEFSHSNPQKPSELEASTDNRALKLGIETIAIREG